MQQDQDIRKELIDAGSILADMPRQMPFQVPESYFGGLPGAVLEARQYETDPVTELPRTLPYAVPEGYFGALAGALTGRIRTGEQAPFAVPEGYFDTLPDLVLAAVRPPADHVPQPSAAKIIPLKRVSPLRMIRLAAAAVLLALAGAGLYRVLAPGNEGIEQRLAGIPRDSIRDYLLHHVDEVETEELAGLAAPLALNGRAAGAATLPVSREDIIQYLDETGWDTRPY